MINRPLFLDPTRRRRQAAKLIVAVIAPLALVAVLFFGLGYFITRCS